MVVGHATAGTCTAAALQLALDKGGVITFSCGGSVVIPVSSTLTVTKDTVIDGGGKVILSGGEKTRILHLKSYTSWTKPKLVLQRLSFQGGRATKGGGGAIWRQGGALVVHGCTFDDNAATEQGGTICGGAIHAGGKGATTIVDSTFSGNSACSGGAVCVISGGMAGSLTVLGSSFNKNGATGQGGEKKTGGQGGAVFLNGGAMTICASTVVGNTAGYLGAGLYRVPGVTGARTVIRGVTLAKNTGASGHGGGAYLRGSAMIIADTAIYSNQAGAGAGLHLGDGQADLINVTVADNTASAMGGGIWLDTAVSGTLLNVTVAGNTGAFSAAIHGGTASVWLQNALIAGNAATNIWEARSCKGQLSDGGGNLQHPPKKKSGQADSLCAAGITLVDPGLGLLGDNGGPTKTMAVKAASPAARRGKQCPPTDQRGVKRGSPCTSGAYEVN